MEEIKLFIDDMMVYKQKSERRDKTTEVNSNNSKVAGHKVNMKKYITFLYTSNEQVKLKN